MKIVNVVDRTLCKEEVESMQRFRSYTDGVSFACLCQGVMVMLHDEPSKDVEKLKAKTQEHMDTALSVHPDFSTWIMDDGHIMIAIPGGIMAISEGVVEDPGPLDFFTLRGKCLEACEDGNIIAVAYEEE